MPSDPIKPRKVRVIPWSRLPRYGQPSRAGSPGPFEANEEQPGRDTGAFPCRLPDGLVTPRRQHLIHEQRNLPAQHVENPDSHRRGLRGDECDSCPSLDGTRADAGERVPVWRSPTGRGNRTEGYRPAVHQGRDQAVEVLPAGRDVPVREDAAIPRARGAPERDPGTVWG